MYRRTGFGRLLKRPYPCTPKHRLALRASAACAMLWMAMLWMGTPADAQDDKKLAQPIDDSNPNLSLPVKIERTFKYLEIDRPIIVTHAGDGTNRLFVASQMGTIYVMPNDPEVEEPAVFMDMDELVTYKDRENEEGFLGMAFHPKFKENGQFFVFYSTSKTEHTSIVSRFTTTGYHRVTGSP